MLTQYKALDPEKNVNKPFFENVFMSAEYLEFYTREAANFDIFLTYFPAGLI